MIPNDLEQHCAALFDILPIPPDAVRHVFLKSPDGVVCTWVRRPVNLARIMRAYAYDGRWNVYWQLNPTRRRDTNRPRNRDVDYLQAVLLDIDPVEADADPEKAADHGMSLLSSQFDVQESTVSIVNSGRGIQLWLHIATYDGHSIDVHKQREELHLKVAPFVRAAATAFGTQHGCRIDTACQDLVRLARVPGTTNLKTGQPCYLVQQGQPAPPYWLRNIEPDPDYVTDAPAVPIMSTRMKWPDIVAHLTHAAYSFITEGVCEPGRHKAAVATVRNLRREIGVPFDVARQLVFTGAGRCTPPLTLKARDISDLERILREEYGAANQGPSAPTTSDLSVQSAEGGEDPDGDESA